MCLNSDPRKLVLPLILACDRETSGRRRHPSPGQYGGPRGRRPDHQAFLAAVLVVHQSILAQRDPEWPEDFTARGYGSCS
jgi:hypothetical protein